MRTTDRSGSSSETIRRDNLSAILREVHLSGPRSRSDLVALSGLNRSTVADLVVELSDHGLVHEERGDSLGTPGRPSPLVHASQGGAVALAVEIAVHSLAVALVGLGGTVHARARVDRPHGRMTLEQMLDDLRQLSLPLVERSDLRHRLVGIGVAAVGAVRSVDGFVHFAPNLGWSSVPMVRLVTETLELGVPVIVRNEADLGARAEHLRGAGIGVDDMIYLSGSVGVGGGIIVGGRPLVGTAGYAGEVGHVSVNPDGWPCGCGSRGCWETEVGERALLRQAGRDPDGGPEEADMVLRDAAQGIAGPLAAVSEVGRWLGIGLAGLVNVFDPRLIVLGGLFQGMAPLTLPIIQRELDARAMQLTREQMRIVPGRLGVDAPLIGAAERALEPLLADPLRYAPMSAAGIRGTQPATVPTPTTTATTGASAATTGSTTTFTTGTTTARSRP